MKFRILSDEELQHFEEDLKHFLIANGVHADEWETINKENPEKAIALVKLFSDSVLQKVYERIKFIEHRTQSSCMVFHMMEESIELISINVKEGCTADLSTPEKIHNALVHQANELTIFTTQKAYNKEREVEIHEMLEQGCVLSDEKFWNALKATNYSS